MRRFAVRSRSLSAAVRICAAMALMLAVNGCQQPGTVRQSPLSDQPEAIPPPTPASEAPETPPAPPAASSLNAPAQLEPPADMPVLGLEDLEQIALINNPSLARAQAMVAAAQGNWVQVGLPPNFGFGYSGQQFGSGPRPTNQAQHGLLIGGELIMGHKLKLNRAVAEHEIFRAQQHMYAQQQRVLTDVRVAFYESLLAQRNLELAQQLLKIASDAQTTAQWLFDHGESAEVDFRQAQLEVYAAENSLNDARQRHFAAWQMLRAVAGVPQMAPSVLRGDLEQIPEEIDFEATLGRLLATSPEIGAAVANIDRAQAALVRAQREPIPNIQFQGGPQEDESIRGKTDASLQVLMPLPFINRNQGAIAQARAEITAAQRALEQAELDLQNRLAPVYERYASAAYRVRNFREKILPLNARQLELVKSGWSKGELPFLNYLIAQQRYFMTNRDYLQSLLDLRTSAAQIEGLLLSNSLGSAL
jgi:cobalt-zinc-cadmium efflux system outer membrane protein